VFSGPPQGYTKCLEQRLLLFESIICKATSSSPSIANQFQESLQDISNGSVVSENDLQNWRNTSPVATLLSQILTGDGGLVPDKWSPIPNSVASVSEASVEEEFSDNSGVLALDEHSVIRYLGPTSGLQLINESTGGLQYLSMIKYC